MAMSAIRWEAEQTNTEFNQEKTENDAKYTLPVHGVGVQLRNSVSSPIYLFLVIQKASSLETWQNFNQCVRKNLGCFFLMRFIRKKCKYW